MSRRERRLARGGRECREGGGFEGWRCGGGVMVEKEDWRRW